MQIVQDRQNLHRIPEPDVRLPKTIAYLRASLEGLPCKVFSPTEGGLCAWFNFGAKRTIAFRADCDALPITEKSGVCFASRHPGYMHACGHDGHMAILLELARRLSQEDTLGCNVLLVFQPAEETLGGAKMICQSGVLDEYGVEAIFGLHLWPGQEAGTVASRKNEMLSRSAEVDVCVTGKAAHIAKAGEGLDAIAAAVKFYTEAVAMEQALDPKVYRLLKFGHLEGGTIRNIVAGACRLEGSLRAFQDDVFDAMRDGLMDIARNVEKTTGCTVVVSFNEGYPAVMNPPALYDRVRSLVDFGELAEPSMISEDFSCYQRHIPGMFFFLGIGNTPALHADTFNFDEQILIKGADFFQLLAEKY